MSEGIERLLEVMRRLRDPETGCPWDVRQDFSSIAPYTIEEAYEVAEAIRSGDLDALRGELGDLLLQVVYHARMAEEAGAFDFGDVVDAVSDKMIRRHPHVFGDADRDDAFGPAEWEREKAREGQGTKSVLDGASDPAAPLARAVTLGHRAARVGFDWPDVEGVLDKVEEEFAELRSANDGAARREEYGDLLFALASLARRLRIDPEAALRRANDKFERRFRAMERRLADEGARPADVRPERLEELWEEEKTRERT